MAMGELKARVVRILPAIQTTPKEFVAMIAVLLVNLSERRDARTKPFTLRPDSASILTPSRANDEKRTPSYDSEATDFMLRLSDYSGSIKSQ